MSRIVEMDLPDDMLGVHAISLVDYPAIEENFIALSKEQKKQYNLAKADSEKRLLVGPALIPNKQIFRNDGDEGYYMYFPDHVVYKAATNFLKNSFQNNHTIMHEERTEGLTVVQSWIVDDPKRDKSNAYGMEFPKGTWMVAVKVDNEQVWEEQVKEGKVKGFSIEAYFAEKLAAKKEDPDKELIEQLTEIKQILKSEI
jgi:hypothetical protein